MFEYAYLLEEFDEAFFVSNKEQPIECIIPINEKVTGKQPALFQTLLQTTNHFCFCISGNLLQYKKHFIKEEIIQNFVRLLFLPNYLKADGKHLLFITPSADQNERLEQLKDELSNEFKKQGIRLLLVEMMPADETPAIVGEEQQFSIVHAGLNKFLANGDSEDNFQKFSHDFTVPANFDKKWIIPVSGTADLANKKLLIDKFENWLKNADPFKVQLIQRFNAAMDKISRMGSENELYKFKLENSAYYLQLIRTESQGLIHEIGSLRLEIHRLTQQILHPETSPVHFSHSLDDPDLIMRMQDQINAEHNRANDTLNWYIKEYEVLPMWYKRSGQLLKVFMGKRTLKSLFKK